MVSSQTTSFSTQPEKNQQRVSDTPAGKKQCCDMLEKIHMDLVFEILQLSIWLQM